jgi:hypothetical protein
MLFHSHRQRPGAAVLFVTAMLIGRAASGDLASPHQTF